MGFCWVTLTVADIEASLAFYRDVVGLSLHRRAEPRPGTRLAFLGAEGSPTEVELISNEDNPSPVHGKDTSLGFTVESLDDTIARVKAAGVEEVEGPFQPAPAIRFAYITDPDGGRVQFVENL